VTAVDKKPVDVSPKKHTIVVSASAAAILLSAKGYVKALSLEEDEEEEVADELQNARRIWEKVVGSSTKAYEISVAAAVSGEAQVDGGDDEDVVLSELMTQLGTTYSEEEHGAALRKIATPSSSNGNSKGSSSAAAATVSLSMEAFSDWYVRWLYGSSDSDAGSEGSEGSQDDDADAEDKDKKKKKEEVTKIDIKTSTAGWGNAQWTVAPGASKDQWKCGVCSVLNKNSDAKCVACCSDNPAAPAPSATSASGTTSSKSSGGISASGFSFGGAVPAASAGGGAVPTFGFGAAAPAAATSTATAAGGFTFDGPVTAAAAVPATAPAAGGFTFNAPAPASLPPSVVASSLM